MKASKAMIDQFLAAPVIALAGVSRDPKKFGYQVFKQMKTQNREVLPINPQADQIDGITCYRSIALLPAGVQHIVLLTPKNMTAGAVSEAVAAGIRNIWIQQMSDTPEAIRLAEAAGVRPITGECIFLHTEPVKGVHKFHRAIRRLFGRMPS